MEMEQFCSVTIEDLKQDLRPLKGKEVTFAGIVIETNHKTGKTGKQFGSFVVEDYFNFITLTVFSEEYLRWKHLLDEGQYLYVKARIEPRFDNPDQLVLRVNTLMLLSEVMEKFTKVLSLTLEINELTVDLIYKLHTLAKEHKGRSGLRVRIQDYAENMTIDLPSKKYRVNAKEIIRELSKSPEIQFKLMGD
ncbi:MAG: OB-fold nucleic acid binding domain-containing protein, partial [Bacteroidota bacterium]